MYRIVTLSFAFFFLLMFFVPPTTAQPARLQLIHNAPDDTLSAVDVYLNEVLWEDDFRVLTATAFRDLPEGNPVNIAVAPSTSTSAADAYDTFSVATPDGATLIAVISGVLAPDAFPPNPDGQDIGLSLIVNEAAHEVSTEPDNVQVFFVQGNPGLPAIHIEENHGERVLAQSLLYGDQSPYLNIEPDNTSFFNVTKVSNEQFRRCFYFPGSEEPSVLTLLVTGLLDNYFTIVAVSAEGDVWDLQLIAESNENELALPSPLSRSHIYPHPVQSSSTLVFDLSEPAELQLVLFNVMGRKVITSPPQRFTAGVERRLPIQLATLPPGMYAYRLRATTALRTLHLAGTLVRMR